MNNRKRILVVEDEQVIRELLTRLLDAEVYDVMMAPSVRGAYALLDQRDFDLLITDLRLPDGNGLDVLRMMKALSPATPAFIITGSLSPDDYLKTAEKLGVTVCLFKPFEVGALVGTVRKYMEESRAA